MNKGYAYQAANGDVYYAVSRFKDYGKLSGKRLEDLRAGERVEVDTAKRDPLDFVLWKSAKPGEPSWPSPWGAGPPRLAYRMLRHGHLPWATISTSTAAAWTCSSRITRTRSPNRKAPPGNTS